ncbi:MAG: phosphoribosylformylglycinamidine cyclo-ligase [Actinomycetota bacterium]|nr:phosphoribosylformylglycinamidine cyclo-ligase [Actinomycetota bacterium]
MADGPRRPDQAPTPKRPPKLRRSTKAGRSGGTPPAGGKGSGTGALADRPLSARPGGGTPRGATAGGATAGGATKGGPPAPPARPTAGPAATAGPATTTPAPSGPATYAGAGVDIAAGEAAVERIKRKVRSTFRPEVISDIGGFGGLFALDTARYRNPVLVSSTDGVGTKALVARQAGRLDTIGIDLVAMVVDDIAAQGAEPLFFLDCISVGRLKPAEIDILIGGIVDGCRQAGCALVGGEMAEVPGMMEDGAFDLVGFGVGVVERSRLVTGDDVAPGDRIIGLPSPGLRSNGYSLARRVLFDQAGLTLDSPAWPDAGHSLADELLRPSVIYTPALVHLCREVNVRALAHITGGGLPGNIPRVLPDNVDAVIHRGTWDVPEIFYQLRELGPISTEEMTAVFNLGIGMVAVVSPDDVDQTLSVLGTHALSPVVIGEIVAGDQQVRFA